MFVKLVDHVQDRPVEKTFIFECSAVKTSKFYVNDFDIEKEDRESPLAYFQRMDDLSDPPTFDTTTYLPFGMPDDTDRNPPILLITPDQQVKGCRAVAAVNASCYIMGDDGKTIEQMRV